MASSVSSESRRFRMNEILNGGNDEGEHKRVNGPAHEQIMTSPNANSKFPSNRDLGSGVLRLLIYIQTDVQHISDRPPSAKLRLRSTNRALNWTTAGNKANQGSPKSNQNSTFYVCKLLPAPSLPILKHCFVVETSLPQECGVGELLS
jgi:hypothetical protein